MSFSYASVVELGEPSARIRRIGLQVEDPDALDVKPGGDSAVGVYFPVIATDGHRTAPGCVTAPDGTRYVDAAPGTEGRNYSVRHHCGDRIDIDVVLHARGPGTSWARTTFIGDRVGLDHARSWYHPPPQTDWQLLVADLSGLPALSRIAEELPDGCTATAVVEVADSEDIGYLPALPDLTVVRSIGTGNGHGPSVLAQLVRDVTPADGRGYCWFAGEAAESRTVRKHFRGQGWDIGQLDITGYWRFDSEEWDAKYALVSDEVEAVWARALADGKGERLADEEYDEALERAGL